jgi:hypothetical protein
MFLEDQMRRFGRDLFDFDAPFARHHQHGLGGGAIENDAEVQFAGDLAAVFDKDAIDRLPSGPVWIVTSVLPSRFGRPLRLHPLGFRLDAALLRVALNCAFAAAAGVDWAYDRQRTAEFFERRRRFYWSSGHLAAEDRDPALPEQLFGLKFVDFHRYRMLCS